MRVRFSPLALLAVAVLAAACRVEPQGEPQAAPEMTAVPTSPCHVASGTVDEARARPSPLSEMTFAVGGYEGTLCYGAPSANGRVIMGALVPFGEIWRLGANEATALHLSGPAVVGGVRLEAGSYSLYAIPGEGEWTFFLNSNVNRWGVPVDDAVRATEVGSFIASVEGTEAFVETLGFRFEGAEGGVMGDVVLEWENTRVRFHLAPGAG